MLSNLSIKQRLIFASTLLVSFLLITNAVGVWNTIVIMDNFVTVAEEEIPKTLAARETHFNVLDAYQSLYELLVVPASDRQRIKDEVAGIRKRNAEAFAYLEQHVVRPDAKEQLALSAEARKTLQPLYDRIYEALEKDPDTAMKIIVNEYRPAYLKVAASAKKLNDIFAESIKNAEHAGKRAADIAGTTAQVLITLALISSLWLTIWMIRSISGPLSQIQNAVTKVQETNDFTVKVEAKNMDEVGKTAKSFNALMDTLRGSLGQIKRSVEEVEGASENLVTASSQSAKVSEMTSESASHMAASVEEMTVSISQVSDNAKSASELASKAGRFSEEGGQVISDTVAEMRKIGQTIDRVSSAIENLGEQSEKISGIVQVIKEVADQTNLLALNAAIEAARAGEAGRGFAVVADEVRKLAERTTQATGEISTMIGNIQTSSNSAVSAMQESVAQVKAGRDLAENAGSAITEIRAATNEVVAVVGNIADAINEQSMASQSIAQQLESVAQGAEENSAAANETARSAAHLGDLAKEMHHNTARFTI